MTTTTQPTLQQTGRRGLSPALHYLLHSTMLTLKNVSFMIFSVGMPVVLYLLFSQLFGNQLAGDGVTYSAMIMISMAAYGSLGAAMSGGAQLALERRSGWFRQLMITTLPPRAFLWSKAGVIMLIVLPALVLVFLAGLLIGGVRAPILVWLASLGLMWLGLIPLTILGIALGLWVKAEAVQGVTTMVMLVLAMLGGLWFPVQMMPSTMSAIAKVTPSYWLGELGRYPFLPSVEFPWLGVLVLFLWSAALTVIGALGYRRAVASSKR